jgi:hypothetical protein
MYKSMISRLEKTVKLRMLGYNLYETFDECMRIFTRKEYPLIHDEFIRKKLGYQIKSYVGTKNCGSACFIMKYLLEREGYDVNVIKNSRRTEYGIEDHVFLSLDDNIFDPTYRQFMIESRNKNKICGYKSHLFGEISPFLINEKEKICYQLQNSLKVNTWVYGTPFIELDELMINWEFQEDVTNDFNLHEYINNKDLLLEKPDYYTYLVDFINSQNLQK